MGPLASDRRVRAVAGAGAAVAAVLACVLALGAPAAALAGPAWLTPTKLTEGPSAGSSRVAVDPAGDAVAVWQHDVGVIWTIEASSRPAGGAWSSPVTLSKATEEAVSPQVAIAPGGSTVAVWERVSGGARTLEAATGSAPSATWQPRQELPAPSSAMPLLARVAIDGAGDAMATWERPEGSNGIVEASFRPAGAGPWRPATKLSETGEYQHPPQVAMDAEGLAVAVWEDKVSGEPEIYGARKPAGGEAWQKAVRVSPAHEIVPHNANEPQLTMDARGDAVAVWERFNEVEEIEAASMPAGTEAWRAPVKISTRVGKEGKAEPGSQQVAIDAQGRAVVVWWRETIEQIEAVAQTSVGGSWGTPLVISEPGPKVSEPALAVDASGDAVAVWASNNGKQVLRSSSRPAGSASWGSPTPLPTEVPLQPEPSLGIDGQGDALASYVRYTGSYEIEADAYDAAGPLLNGLSIPTSATVGQALSFSVSPFDVWSALGATTWSFGDGATATGTGVSHAYTEPGSYTVTVTGTDALGNATSASGTVAVAVALALGNATSASGTVAVAVAGSTVPYCLCVLAVPAPTILTLSQSRSRWREGAHLASLARKHSLPVGTVFSFALNTPATVTFAFTQPASGRRVGKRCVAPSHGNRRKPKCTRTVLKGSIVLPAHTGARKLSFQGRVSASNELAPGTYTLRLTAANIAGVSPARTLTFTIGR